MSILAGRGGFGKGVVTADLAARLTTEDGRALTTMRDDDAEAIKRFMQAKNEGKSTGSKEMRYDRDQFAGPDGS